MSGCRSEQTHAHFGWVLATLALSLLPRLAAATPCGDGVVDADEACDLGIANDTAGACTPECTQARCGDGMRHHAEGCDDGNAVSGDGCDTTCRDESEPLWSHTFNIGDGGFERFGSVAYRQGRAFVLSDTGWRGYWDTSIKAYDIDGLVWETPRLTYGVGAIHAIAADDARLYTVGHYATPRHGVFTTYTFDGTPIGERAFLEVRELRALAVGPDGHVFLGGRSLNADLDVWFGRYDVENDHLVWSASPPRRGTHDNIVELAYRDPIGLYTLEDREHGYGLTRLDPSTGESLWSLEPTPEGASPGWGSVTGLALTDEGVVVVGDAVPTEAEEPTQPMGAWISGFSPDGERRWLTFYEDADARRASFSSVVALPDGRLVATGTREHTSLMAEADTDVDAVLVAFDDDGGFHSELRWDGPLHLFDAFAAAAPTPDGGVIAVGHTVEAFASTVGYVGEYVVPAPAPTRLHEAPATPGLATTHALGDIATFRAADAPCEAEPPRATALFVDFDGARLSPGDDGRRGEVPCTDAAFMFPGYDDERDVIEAVMARVEEILAPYDITVYWEHPPPRGLPYTTVLVGGAPEQIGLPPGTSGLACAIDCRDDNPNDLAFVLQGEGSMTLANTIVHEAAHTWGLDHVVDTFDVMAPFDAGLDRSLLDTCIEVSTQTSAPTCLQTHAAFCEPDRQNGHAELEALFGPRRVDDTAPVLSGLPDAITVAPGEPIVLALGLADDSGTAGLELHVPALDTVRVLNPDDLDLAFYLPEGEHTVELRAYDHAGNETVEPTTVVVDESVLGGSSGNGDSDDPVGSSSTGDDTAGVSSTTAGGCACSTSGPGDPPSPGWLGAGLWVLGLRLRRPSGA